MNLLPSVWRSSWIALILLALPLAGGCGSLGSKRASNFNLNFIKPLASATSVDGGGESQPLRSESSLCIETAQTVARQGHAVEAIKLYERAEELEPTATPLDEQLAPLYAHVGNLPASIERYQRCVQRSPEDAQLSNNYAWTLMEAERYDQAIAEATRGLQRDADNVRLQSTLAMIHYRSGDHASALQHFDQAHGTTAAHHNMAILDINAGSLESARSHLQIALQSSPANPQSEALLAAIQKHDQSF